MWTVAVTLDDFNLDQQSRSVKTAGLCLAGIGLFQVLRVSSWVLQGLWKYCIVPRRNLRARYGGGWALVTGASDGIGKQYANTLAKEGFNIVLMARDQAKLGSVAKEIREAHKVETQVVVYDFSKLATEESVRELKDKLAKELPADISILVNNVGVSKAGLLDRHSVWEAMRQVNVNVNSMTYMTRLLLPRLLARDPKKSAIINIASRSAQVMSGFTPIYCATKSYNLALSQCLQDSYGDQLDILTVTPHSTMSAMMPGGKCWVVSAERHATAAVNQLGWVSQTRGSIVHALEYPVTRYCPPIAASVFVYDLLRLKAFLKKIDEKEAEEAQKHGKMAERTAVFEALGVLDEGNLTLVQRLRQWFLRD